MRCQAKLVERSRRVDEGETNLEQAPKGSSHGGLRLLQLAAFFSSFDRFAVAPMLVTIAASLGTSLAGVAATASLYYLLYGVMQPVWGMLSDRLGRVRVMRLTLFGAVFAGVISALAPNLAVLAAARALAGGLFAAVIPAALVYVGDTVGIDSRQKALADLMAASAVGTALATVLGGLAAYLGAWRLAFAAPALAGGVLAILLARLPEPEGFSPESREGPMVQVGRVFGRPWAVTVVVIAAVEGAVIMGFSPATAGLAVGLYGLAVLGWTRVVKLVSNRLGAAALILIGGGMLAVGYASGAVGHSLVGVGIAAVLVGGGFAFMHSTLQTWATEVVPEARATVISLFAAALFAGSGLATAAAAPLADESRFGLLFATAALVAVPLGLFAALARQLYAGYQT